MKTPRYYIAYGSNLNISQMSRRCPTATVAGQAEIQDYQLLFRGKSNSAFATIEPAEKAAVSVLVWELTPQDEQALDRFEGFPVFYQKENMTVELKGKPVEAMVYIMSDGHEIGMPSDKYLDTILEGYEDAGFDTAPLEKAMAISQELAKNWQELDLDDYTMEL